MRQIAPLRQPSLFVGRLIVPRHGLLALPVGGKNTVAETKDDDSVPLESLRSVYRQNLYGARVRFTQRRFQTFFSFVSHPQVGEERPERRARCVLVVCGGHGDELVERGAASHRQWVRDHVVQGAHDEDRALDLLGDRASHALAHLTQPLAQQTHSAHRLLADCGPPLGRPPGLRRGIHRIQENRLMRVNTLLTCQETRPVAQRHQVGRTQVNASQQASQPRGCLDVVCQFQGGAHILHGRLIEQPAQAHNLRGDASLAQRGIDEREVLASPTKDGNSASLTVLRRLRAYTPHKVDGRGQGLVVGLRIRDVHRAAPRPTPGNQDGRLRFERILSLLIGRHFPQGCRHPIGRIQNRHVVTPGR